MIPLSRIVSASRLFALRTSVFAHGPGPAGRGRGARASRPAGGATDPARAGCPSADPGSAERPRPRSRGRGTFGRGSRRGLPSIGTTERRAGRLATLPRKRTPRYYDYSLLAASYPNYIDPISLHISSLSRDRRRGLCGPTPGLFERRGLCGPAELAAEGGCGEAARSRRGPDSIAPAAQIRYDHSHHTWSGPHSCSPQQAWSGSRIDEATCSQRACYP